MGSGKTTVGPLLAAAVGLAFVDLDTVAEELAGATVAQIFASEGESGWRLRESRALESVLERNPLVLACGGGIILNRRNREILRDRFLTVYLDASEETLFERLRHQAGRPLLEAADPKEAISRLYIARRPVYEDVAHITIPTDDKRPKEIADEAAAAYRKLLGSG